MDWRPWMDAFLPPLLEALPGRVAFVGIQGSFGRGEAGPESDVDLVVVLDALGAAELAACRGVLEKMPFADRACGFFCDRAALAAWPAFDALQLRLDTLPVYGSLEELLPPMGKETLDEAVRAAASALYHAACHTALLTPSRRRPSPPSKRRPSCPAAGPLPEERPIYGRPPVPAPQAGAGGAGPAGEGLHPARPHGVGQGRDGILTQALPGMQQTPAPNRRGGL